MAEIPVWPPTIATAPATTARSPNTTKALATGGRVRIFGTPVARLVSFSKMSFGLWLEDEEGSLVALLWPAGVSEP